MIYLANALSINMFSHFTKPFKLNIKPISTAEASTILKSTKFTSAIGHADIANILTNILGVNVTPNRITLNINPGDTLIIAQYIGPRLPEGTTELPVNATIKFYLITIEA